MKNKNGLTFGQRFKIFLKKNGFALAVTACAIMLVVALAVTAIVKTNHNKLLNIDIDSNPNLNQGQEVLMPDIPNNEMESVASDDVLSFIMPIKNYTMGESFVNDNVVYNSTMNEWSTHEGIDFVTEAPESVMSTADGVVESVDYSALEGTIIIIKHTDEIKSVYKSISENVEVEVGQYVKAGDIIGETSTSASRESGIGNHLHFEILENNVKVNPFDYIMDK
jgi:murein DD-endopeptidase MepM/ murein hydrolase activator NlpD